MTKKLRTLRLVSAAAFALALGGVPAHAEDVTLKSFDGAISLTGELLSVEGSTAIVRTPMGDLRVNMLEMTCTGAACPAASSNAAEFSVAGASGLVGAVVPKLLEGYAAARLDAAVTGGADGSLSIGTEGSGELVKVALQPGSSTEGLDAIRAGASDLAVTTRPATADERISAKTEKVLGLDGIVVLTHPSNPVRVLSSTELPKVFSGAVTRWSDLGGFDADITIYAQAADSSTVELFDRLVMDASGASLGGKITVLDSDAAVAEAVAADPFGIGIGTFSTMGTANPVIVRGACGVQTPANAFTIRTEDYPLTTRLFLYSGKDVMESHAAEFVDFAMSDEGQLLMSQAGYVDQRVSAELIDNQGIRIASAMMDNGTDASFKDIRKMMGDLVIGSRLSLTFRFEFGSANLDSRAQGDVVRLAELLSTGDFANKEVLLVGFTDALGEQSKNRALSQSRAEVVKEALMAAAPAGSLDAIQIRAVGYGEAAPIVCNDTDAERAINRRVEVWVSDVVNNG